MFINNSFILYANLFSLQAAFNHDSVEFKSANLIHPGKYQMYSVLNYTWGQEHDLNNWAWMNCQQELVDPILSKSFICSRAFEFHSQNHSRQSEEQFVSQVDDEIK